MFVILMDINSSKFYHNWGVKTFTVMALKLRTLYIFLYIFGAYHGTKAQAPRLCTWLKPE